MTLQEILAVDIGGQLRVDTKALKLAAASLITLVSHVMWRSLVESGPEYGKAAGTAERVWQLSKHLQGQIQSAKER